MSSWESEPPRHPQHARGAHFGRQANGRRPALRQYEATHELALSSHQLHLGFPRPGARECGRAGVVSALLDRITVYAVAMNVNESSFSVARQDARRGADLGRCGLAAAALRYPPGRVRREHRRRGAGGGGPDLGLAGPLLGVRPPADGLCRDRDLLWSGRRHRRQDQGQLVLSVVPDLGADSGAWA